MLNQYWWGEHRCLSLHVGIWHDFIGRLFVFIMINQPQMWISLTVDFVVDLSPDSTELFNWQ